MSVGSIKVAVHRLRRRCGELLREKIAETVESPEEIDLELRELFAALRP
jgi:RNA polymerase sigma-70 factor (ECF subfamily)